MFLEPREAGRVVGPLAAAIIAEQFQRTYFGATGTYWLHDDPASLKGFLWQAQHATMAKVLQQNSGVDLGQSCAFKLDASGCE